MKYRTIAADPPWKERMVGKWQRPKAGKIMDLPYSTMTIPEICALPVADLAETGAHLWLWTTNSHLRQAFEVMAAWGFTYLNTVTWVKPSGFGAYFANTTQHVLFGYFERCKFEGRRWAPTHFTATPKRHSQKPEEFYALAEQVSLPLRLELFARTRRDGWDAWGNEVESDIALQRAA